VGNWRTVNIVGQVAEVEVAALRAVLVYNSDNWDNFGPLAFDVERPSLAGLGDWVRPQIFACGNLAERDYSVEDVAEAIRRLLTVAPSLDVQVHCGGDWESAECVATVTASGGQVRVCPPQVTSVAPVGDDVAAGRLLRAMTRRPA
jgi:hypothetical protein